MGPEVPFPSRVDLMEKHHTLGSMTARRRGAPRTRAQAALRSAVSATALATLAAGFAGCAGPEKVVRRLDEGQVIISRSFADVVDAVDRIFGEPRVEDRERLVQVKAGARAVLRENQTTAYDFPVSLRVPLPALERRTNISLRVNSIAEASGKEGGAAESLDRNKTVSATLLMRVLDQLDTGVQLDLHWHDGAQTGIRPFLRWEWRPSQVSVSFEQQVYVLTDTGVGMKSVIEIDRVLDEASVVRLRNIFETNQQAVGEEIEHALIYRRPFPFWNAALSAEIGAAYNPFDGDPETLASGGENDPDEIFARLRVTGRILRPWIEYEVTPALFRPWRHSDDFEYGVMFTLRLVAASPLAGPGEP